LVNLAMEANRNGDFFPVWGTCMGYELLLVALGRNDNILNHFNDSDNHSQNLKFLNIHTSKIFHDFNKEDLEYSHIQKPFYFNHHDGLTVENFQKNEHLKDLFEITSLGYTKNGTEFIGSIEGKDYPIFGVQFHPEKNSYIWVERINAVHTAESIVLMQKIANFFNRETRKNFHQFKDSKYLESLLIYNYSPHKIAGSSFNSCYFFEN
jgi:gamma-glutamyl hydrolase